MDSDVNLEWLVPSLLVLAGIGIGLWQYIQGRRKQLLVDLQGNKDAVGAVAMRVWSGRFPKGPMPWSTTHRLELFEALCLAAVFQRSGRSRSLIYGALADAGQTPEYAQEIRKEVDRITLVVSRSWAYTDLHRARRRVSTLRAALHLDDDVRIRLDEFELNVSSVGRDFPLDDRLRHRAFEWKSLQRLLTQRESFVLVGTPEPATPVIALEYHRIARQTGGTGPERMVPSAQGADVIRSKYGDAGAPRQRVITRLVDQLGLIAKVHPYYASAGCVAGVPGRSHDFSEQLAAAVAKNVKKPRVSLTRLGAGEAGPATQRFTTDDASVAGATVVLVDDVYRSGRTLQAAASALRAAGANDVLGLTATCTISATAPPCSHTDDHGDHR